MNVYASRLLFIILFSLSSVFLHAQKTKYVVVIMIDGARYSETFGDSSHSLIPFIWNELKPQGVIYPKYYNDGKTQTNPGHASVLSGTWQYIANDGSEYSHSPTIFEYFRKQKNIPASECWVALGKTKLNVLANSTHPEYGAAFGASVRYSNDPASDQLTMENVQYVLKNNRSRITIANFARTDIDGHAGSWENYTAAIKKADSLVAVLWRSIQADTELKNKTTMIVTNDHGRHTTDFSNHGDGCDGCRHIMLMVLGPDTPKGVVDSTLTSQIDIAPTIGKMMRFSTPLANGKVIESAIASAANVSLTLKNTPTGTISGDYPIQWSLGAVKESVTTLIEFSGDGGAGWQVIASSASRDSQFVWKTTGVPDGTRYRMRIQVYGDTTYGFVQTPNEFTIDNAGNGAPDVTLLSPDRNVIISGMKQIVWKASDAEGSALTLSIYASTDSGSTWTTLAAGLANTGTYDWNTVQYANSKQYIIKLVCSDGMNLRTVFSPRFEVMNVRTTVQSVHQTGGSGNGIISVNVCAPEQMTGHVYTVTFTEGIPFGKRYSIVNTTTNTVKLSGVSFSGDGSEGPLFDGLRIAVTDFAEPTHNADSTKWIVGTSTLFSKVVLPELVLPEGIVVGVPEAADYEIRISGTVVDTSKEYFGAFPTPLYFTVYNTSKNRKTPVLLSELSPDGKLSFGDDLYLFTKDSSGKDQLTWEVIIDGNSGSGLPQPGDIYRIATNKPITGNDTFEFTAKITSMNDPAGAPGKFMLSQNYPNPFNPTTSILATIPLAGNVSIDIYDLLGRKVSTLIEAAVTAGEHRYEWNASAFVSGVYFYRMTVNTADGSQRWMSQVHKMILLK